MSSASYTARPICSAVEGVIAGSANFTCGGLQSTTASSHIAQYQPNVVALAEAWFDELWENAEDYRERLVEILTARDAQTWTPHDVYLRALLELYEDDVDLLGRTMRGWLHPWRARWRHSNRLSAPRVPSCTQDHRAL